MKLLQLSSQPRVSCDICRRVMTTPERMQRGSLTLCASCALPRVRHEDQELRRLLMGDDSAKTAGDLRRWFVC